MRDLPTAAVRHKVESWLGDDTDGAPVLLLRARPEWGDDPRWSVDGRTVRVVGCTTPLAARAAIHELAGDERLVLLTELDDAALGDGILAHVSRQRVRTIDRWQLVNDAFDATQTDPALVRCRWAADALITHQPPHGWPAVRGSVLTRAHALRCLTGVLLGVDPASGSAQLDGGPAALDSAGLLRATTRPSDLLAFTNLPPAVSEGIGQFVTETAGPAASPIMAAVRKGHGADAVPLGLIAGALWAGRSTRLSNDVVRARTRLEPRLGRMTDEEATGLSEAAEAWVQRLAETDEHQAARLYRRAETIAAELDIAEHLRSSPVIPLGFTQRLRDLAERLHRAVSNRSGIQAAALGSVEDALKTLRRHRNGNAVQLDTAHHAVRLVRWLATPDTEPPATLLDAVLRQARVDGWVDRAKLAVHAGSTDPAVADAYRLLFDTVDVRRARHDERFARLLATATRADAEPGRMLRVEDALDRVVTPILSTGRRVLLLVLDGMNVAAATELAESVTRGGAWNELTPGGTGRTGVLAALPTVTEVSRCSLLSGTITTGGQDEERTALAARYPGSLLLHKANLRAGAGAALDPQVVHAVADANRPLVTAVVNTIDDALDRSDPGTTDWNLETIRSVDALLAHAGDRVVIAISDHGHVVDRGPDGATLPGRGGGNRWRPAGGPVRDGEIDVAGHRVALGGGHVVLPFREELRYGPLKSGYHGGASAAETVIPLLVFVRDDEEVAGWASAPVPSPDWWRESPTLETPAATRPKRRTTPSTTETLFELPAAPVTAAPASPAPATPGRSILVAGLLASKQYRQRRDTRAALPDERVAALLEVLLGNGNRASFDTLAARADIPAFRIRGVVTALRKLLQVEGYPVLDVDADGVTVVLNRTLLVEQFGLGQT